MVYDFEYHKELSFSTLQKSPSHFTPQFAEIQVNSMTFYHYSSLNNCERLHFTSLHAESESVILFLNIRSDLMTAMDCIEVIPLAV